MTWSRGLRVTSAIFALVVAAAFLVPLLTGALPGLVRWMPLVAVPVLILPWAMAPRRLAVGGGEVRVERNAWPPVRIPLASLEEVAEIAPETVRRSVRIGGSGGAFGYFGRFRNGALGSYRMYATRQDRLVALRGAGRTWVVTPDRPEPFVEAVLAVAPRARRWGEGAEVLPATAPAPAAPEEKAPAGAGSRGRRFLNVAGPLLSVAALAAFGATLARAPREVGLERGAVVIHRYLWPAERIPVASIRAASVLPPEALEGARRVRGARVLGSLYGTFESPALGRFEIEAPHTGLVLLETPDGDVVVGVVDPERFQARVTAALRGRPPPR
jgi:hypothetical protein